jgi:hypothetical protein
VNAAEHPVTSGKAIRFSVDLVAREQRLKKADEVREQLPRGPKGDISL